MRDQTSVLGVHCPSFSPITLLTLLLAFLWYSNSTVPHGPVTIEWHKRGALYIHVGVGITLREKPGQLPFISYNSGYKNFWTMFLMRISQFFLWWVLTFNVDRHHLIGGIVTSIEETIETLEKQQMSWPGLSGLYEEYVYNTHEWRGQLSVLYCTSCMQTKT